MCKSLKLDAASKKFIADWRELTSLFIQSHFMFDGKIDISEDCYKEISRYFCRLPQIYLRHKEKQIKILSETQIINDNISDDLPF